MTEEKVRRPGLPHLPGLDGLRGAAVVLVLLFHGGFPWARGGFLGVTMFFVLSGFLITSLLIVERGGSGTIDLRAFWARRARRLAPALVVLLALVVAYAAFASPRGQGALTGDAVATLTWVANWRFVFAHRSYGDLFSQPSPFQHAWSLGVEEQFYLVLPLLAALLLRRRRLAFGIVVALGVVASTAAAALLHSPGAAAGHAYYGTDARVAEPLVGVLLALLLVGPHGLRQVNAAHRLGRAAFATLGIAGAVALGFLVTRLTERSDALYRGGFLITALATAGVVAACTQSGVVTRGLSFRPLAALGRISYGVYLFHWPIFLWVTSRRTGLSSLPLFAVRCGFTLVLAIVSYVVVEQPVRLRRIAGRWVAIAWANAGVGLLAALVGVTTTAPAAATGLLSPTGPAAAAPVPSVAARPPAAPRAAQPAAATTPTSAARTATTSAARAVGTARPSAAAATPTTAARPAGGAGSGHLNYGPPSSAPPPPTTAPTAGNKQALKVAMVGDSMANGLATGLTTWANQRGDVVVYDLSTVGCPLSRGGGRRLADGTDVEVRSECGWWADPSSDRSEKLAEFAPDVIVVQDGMNEVPDRKLPSWPSYRHTGQPQYDTWLLNEYSDAMKTFTANGAKVLFLNTVCADWETVGGGWADYENNGDGDARVASLDRTDQAITVTGVQSGDLQGHLCPNGKFTQTIDGVKNARPDGYHLSDAASLAVAQKWLGPLVLQQVSHSPL